MGLQESGGIGLSVVGPHVGGILTVSVRNRCYGWQLWPGCGKNCFCAAHYMNDHTAQIDNGLL